MTINCARSRAASFISNQLTWVLAVAGPALGSVENVNKVFSVAALSTMIALTVGIDMIAGEYRHRTIVGSNLGEPRRSRVVVAKLVTASALGVALGAAARHTVGAIIDAIIWVQVIEVGVLQPSVPAWP